jgi:hypothetical protein
MQVGANVVQLGLGAIAGANAVERGLERMTRLRRAMDSVDAPRRAGGESSSDAENRAEDGLRRCLVEYRALARMRSARWRS